MNTANKVPTGFASMVALLGVVCAGLLTLQSGRWAGSTTAPLPRAAPEIALAGERCFATINVTTVYSSIDGAAVQQAINAASPNDTVKIAGYCAGRTPENAIAIIGKPLTLAGGYTNTVGGWNSPDLSNNATTLDAIGIDAVVKVNATATLIGFTVTNGIVSGIDASQAVTLTDMSVFSNTAVSGGGARFLKAANVTRSNFISNSASGDGGGIYAAEALTLTQVTMMRNATDAYGGGVRAPVNVHVVSSRFVSNTASQAGAGLHAGRVTLQTSAFEQNRAADCAGMNALGELRDMASTFERNHATLNGGGFCVGADATLTETRVVTNSAIVGNGGGIYASGSGTITLTRALLRGNVAGASGGGAMLLKRANVSSSHFVSNTASGGGAVAIDVGDNTPIRFTNNLFARNWASGNGAALFIQSLTEVTLLNNTVASPTFVNKAAFYVELAPADPDEIVLALVNTLVSNHATGTALVTGFMAEFNTFYHNVTTPSTGGFVSSVHIRFGTAGFRNPFADDYHLTFESDAINQGTGLFANPVDGDGDPRPQGGGVDIGYDESPFGAVCYAQANDSSVFTSTHAGAVRAAVAVAAPGSTVKIAGYCAGVAADGPTTQVVYLSKTLTLAGAYTHTNWLTPNANNVTTLDARAGGRGILAMVDASVRDVTVISGLVSGQGAGIAAAQEITLTRVKLIDNVATGGSVAYGGGLLASKATISASVFSGNRADIGGAAYLQSRSRIHSSEFRNNSATLGGGGLYVHQGDHQIVDTLIQENVCDPCVNAGGGGVWSLGSLSLDRVRVIGNQTPGPVGGLAYGGGTMVAAEYALAITNSLFARNAQGTPGAQLGIITAGKASVQHSTIASPTVGASAAIVVSSGDVRIINTLIASHTTGIWNISGLVNEDYNLYSGVATPRTDNVLSGTHSLTSGAAGFVNPLADDYHLTAASAARDKGTDAGVNRDFDGDVRPLGSKPDIGYDEVNAPARRVMLPVVVK